ncbi:MAG: hypothetical protein ACF788_02180, partial [Novipirellula sp. JB048]
ELVPLETCSKNRMIRPISDRQVVTALAVMVIVFFGLAGTINSGYHFTDDHELLRFNEELSTKSFPTVAAETILQDLEIRFRPLYYLHRVGQAKIFGTHFVVWSIYHICLLAIALWSFYAGMRNLSYSISESLCFLVVALVGAQMEVWWRLGPSETLGTTLLGLSFYFMTRHAGMATRNRSLFCFFLIGASLCKESFLVVIPAFVVFKIWHDKAEQQVTLRQSLQNNAMLMVPLATMLLSLLVIVFAVGTKEIGYAGLESNLTSLAKGIHLILRYHLIAYETLIAIFLVLLYIELKDERRWLSSLRSVMLPLTFAGLIIVPNVILYAKSGMGGRYYLPTTIGIAFFTAALMRATRIRLSWLSTLFAAFILLWGTGQGFDAFLAARRFTLEGAQTKELVSEIRNNNNASARILLVADPVLSHEWSISLKTYLSTVEHIDCYGYPLEDPSTWGRWADVSEPLRAKWHTWFENELLTDFDTPPNTIVFFDKGLSDRFFRESDITQDHYASVLSPHSPFAMFVRKDQRLNSKN